MPYSADDFKKTDTQDALVAAYKAARPMSGQLNQRAQQLYSALGATHMGRIYDPYLMYISHAKGSKKWDVDGNEYIDYYMGHGALILGHNHPAVEQAVQEQLVKGVHFGANHPLEVEWGELIQQLLPMAERIEYTACGQEADMLAVRLARIFTGRRKILKFDDHYHGWNDELLVSGAGVQAENTGIIPHDLEALEKELATGEYAVLMMEGGGAHMGGMCPLRPEFAKAAGELARKYGTLWVIDEVVTGFRDSVSGWQGVHGLKPDLTTLGKCLAGGLPAGAVVGRADIMEMFNPASAGDKWLMHGGTWNANPLQCAAGIAACKLYLDGEPQRKANEIAADFRQKGNAMLKELGVNARLYGRSIVHLYLGEIEVEPENGHYPPLNDFTLILHQEGAVRPVRTRLSMHLHQRGIATALGRMFIFSAVHTEEDVDRTLDALAASICAMRKEGTWII